jgi:protein transport protein SEC24
MTSQQQGSSQTSPPRFQLSSSSNKSESGANQIQDQIKTTSITPNDKIQEQSPRTETGQASPPSIGQATVSPGQQLSFQMPAIKSRQERYLRAQQVELAAKRQQATASPQYLSNPLQIQQLQQSLSSESSVPAPTTGTQPMSQPSLNQPPSVPPSAVTPSSSSSALSSPQQPFQQRSRQRLDPRALPRPVPSPQKITNYNTESSLPPPPASSLFTVNDKGSCSPKFMRSTIYTLPLSKDAHKQCGIPLSLVVQPLADPGIDCPTVPVVDFGPQGPLRCRRCKAYINPFVQFRDNGHSYICKFCYCDNEVPEEYFSPLEMNGLRRDVAERAELWRGSVDFVAPQEMTGKLLTSGAIPNPPTVGATMPSASRWVPVYLFVIDTSAASVQSQLLNVVVASLKTLMAEFFEKTVYAKVGFITYDSSVHFYNISPQLKKPQMTVVPDVNTIFLPLPTYQFIGHYTTCKDNINQLLERLPMMFNASSVMESAMGAAINAALLALSNSGGKVFIFQAGKPHYGAGAIKPRDDYKLYNTDKEKALLTCENSFYKKIGEECAKRYITVDLFLCTSYYCDLASIGEVPKLTCGQVYYYPYFHGSRDSERLFADLKRNVTRQTGFEAVMRVRCSVGLSVASYHGHFYASNQTDIDLASVDSDKTFLVNLQYDDSLEDKMDVLVQCALLYTTPKGQRLIRVHTLALKSSSVIINIFKSADVESVVYALARRGIDDITTKSLAEARITMQQHVVNILLAYRKYCAMSSASSQLVLPESFKFLPLYVGSLLKHPLFSNTHPILRFSVSFADLRSFFIHYFSILPLSQLAALIYPNLYAIHLLNDDEGEIKGGIVKLPSAIRLSIESIQQEGIYLLDNGLALFLYITPQSNREMLAQLFKNIDPIELIFSMDSALLKLERNDTELSRRVWTIIDTIRERRIYYPPLQIVRARDKLEAVFFDALIEDARINATKSGKGANQDLMSYVDFLCSIHKKISDAL